MQPQKATDQTCIRAEVDAEKIRMLREALHSHDRLETLTALMKAAGSDTRMRILYLLWTADELCVCDLADVLELSQPAISQQLKNLRESGLVESRREAQTIYHGLSTGHPFARMLAGLFEDQTTENINFGAAQEEPAA